MFITPAQVAFVRGHAARKASWTLPELEGCRRGDDDAAEWRLSASHNSEAAATPRAPCPVAGGTQREPRSSRACGSRSSCTSQPSRADRHGGAIRVRARAEPPAAGAPAPAPGQRAGAPAAPAAAAPRGGGRGGPQVPAAGPVAYSVQPPGRQHLGLPVAQGRRRADDRDAVRPWTRSSSASRRPAPRPTASNGRSPRFASTRPPADSRPLPHHERTRQRHRPRLLRHRVRHWRVFLRRAKTSRSYFLADKSVGWVAIGASLFAANISSEHFIGWPVRARARAWRSVTSNGWPCSCASRSRGCSCRSTCAPTSTRCRSSSSAAMAPRAAGISPPSRSWPTCSRRSRSHHAGALVLRQPSAGTSTRRRR